MKRIQIAIDGPSGAGKSTVARALAERLGIVYVDTGALYRTVGYYVRQQETDPRTPRRLQSFCRRFIWICAMRRTERNRSI